jgi:large subunit ribosomal protein L15
MPISLSTIKVGVDTSKKRKRVGRGNASGHGTYSGRGLKGQGSRAGVSNLKRKGMRQVLLRTPKKRGFISDKPKAQIVNLVELNKYYKDKEVVSPESLYKKGLIESVSETVKILGKGKLSVKDLQFERVKMSDSVKAQIEGTK